MKKSVLVRNGRHMRPMLAVLQRYDVGEHDQYNRGRWIRESDLPRIYEGMMYDPTPYASHKAPDPFVIGTNIHNTVSYHEFEELFTEKEGEK